MWIVIQIYILTVSLEMLLDTLNLTWSRFSLSHFELFLLSKNLNDTMQLQLKKFWHEILPKEIIMHNSSSYEWKWLDKNYI